MADQLAVDVLGIDLKAEDVVEQHNIAFHAHHFSQLRHPPPTVALAFHLRDQVRDDLTKAGFSDVKVMPESFLVRAKDPKGNPVMMVIKRMMMLMMMMMLFGGPCIG